LLETHSKNLKFVSDERDAISLRQQECDNLFSKLEKQQREQDEIQAFVQLETERIAQINSDLAEKENRVERYAFDFGIV
jgi:hypothetical protein